MNPSTDSVQRTGDKRIRSRTVKLLRVLIQVHRTYITDAREDSITLRT